jgi:hypothetical protein
MDRSSEKALDHMRRISIGFVWFIAGSLPVFAGGVGGPILECPQVMVHRADPAAHPGWAIYSNDPLRLSGADVMYVVDSHLEATLDADEVRRLNDESQTEISVFHVSAHRRQGPFTLVCQYGDHAQLAREIPKQARECTVLRRQFFAEGGAVEVKCR